MEERGVLGVVCRVSGVGQTPTYNDTFEGLSVCVWSILGAGNQR